VEAIPKHLVLMGTWGRRTYVSSGGEVRRPRSQLSGPGRTSRLPKDKGEVTDNLAPIGLDTLVGGTPVCMYRQRPPGPPRMRNEPAGGAISLCCAGWTACSDGGRPRPVLLQEPRPRHPLNSGPGGPRTRSRGRRPGGSTRGRGDRSRPLRALSWSRTCRRKKGPSGPPKD
jgi:hypothetical protein